MSSREISARLQAEFDVEAERATESVRALVDALVQHNLVQAEEGDGGAARA
jgi:hypothetical protein